MQMKTFSRRRNFFRFSRVQFMRSNNAEQSCIKSKSSRIYTVMSYRKVNQLKLLQWNAQGASTQSVIAQIDHRIKAQKIDIAFIGETFTKEHHHVKLTNYVVYRNDRDTHGGGVLIAIRNDIEHNRLPQYNTQVAENISIEVKLESWCSLQLTYRSTQCITKMI